MKIQTDKPIRQKCQPTAKSEEAFYCTKYHNKWKVIESFRRKFEKAGNKFGEELCEMFLSSKTPNPLQPTHGMKTKHGIDSKIFSHFVTQFCEKYLPVMLAMMETLVSGKEGKKVKDLRARAKLVATLLIEKKYKKLRLMDGHGRMFFLICEELIERKQTKFLDTLEIELVDTSKEVNAYHKSIFKDCKNVKVICQDILDMELKSDTLLYLNFCGISLSRSKVAKLAEKTENAFILSYSLSQRAASKNYIQGFKTKNGSFTKLTTERKDFTTYTFYPNEKVTG